MSPTRQSKAVLIIAVSMLVLFANLGFNEGSFETQKENFLRNDIAEIADYIRENKILVSKTISRPTILQLSSEQQILHNQNHELMKILFEKIKEFEKTQTKADIDTISNIVYDYVTIGNAVSDGGGYVNYVMGDVFYRMSLSRLAFFLLENPTRYDEVERLWRKLKRPNFEISQLATILQEEIGIPRAESKLESALSKGLLYKTTEELIQQHRKPILIESKEDMKNIFSTSYLLENENVSLLLWRMGETDLMLESLIPGLIEFLRRGGEIDNLERYLKDVGPFLSLMDTSLKKLKANYFGHAQLDIYQLFAITRLFRMHFKNNIFYESALH